MEKTQDDKDPILPPIKLKYFMHADDSGMSFVCASCKKHKNKVGSGNYLK